MDQRDLEARIHGALVLLVEPEIARLCREAYLRGEDLRVMAVLVVDPSSRIWGNEAKPDWITGGTYKGTFVSLIPVETVALELSMRFLGSNDLSERLKQQAPEESVYLVSVAGSSVNISFMKPYIFSPGGNA